MKILDGHYQSKLTIRITENLITVSCEICGLCIFMMDKAAITAICGNIQTALQTTIIYHIHSLERKHMLFDMPELQQPERS